MQIDAMFIPAPDLQYPSAELNLFTLHSLGQRVQQLNCFTSSSV
jgi:hypothetical protein